LTEDEEGDEDGESRGGRGVHATPRSARDRRCGNAAFARWHLRRPGETRFDERESQCSPDGASAHEFIGREQISVDPQPGRGACGHANIVAT
jgi:hypothetical protein